jgi:putative copper resistance protein D
MTDDAGDALLCVALFCVQAGFAILLARALLIGALSDESGPWARSAIRRMGLFARVSQVLMVAGLIASLWLEGAVMLETSAIDASASLPMVITESRFGAVWSVACACLLALIALDAAARRPPRRAVRAAMLVLLTVFAWARAALGHAAAGGLGSVWVLVDAVHLLSMGAWVGAVVVAAWTLAPLEADSESDHRAQLRLLEELSRIATIALAGVTASGVANAWRGVGSVGNLWSTAYGELVVAKVAIVILALVLGASIRLYLLPSLRAAQASGDVARFVLGRRQLVTILRCEGLALGIALACGVLVARLAPPVAPG